MKRVNIAIDSGGDGQEVRIVLSDAAGTGSTRLSFVPYPGNVGAEIGQGRVPFPFRLPFNIIKSTGLKVLEGRIQRAEEDVLQGYLCVENNGAIHHILVRPSELAILLECLEGIPLYIDDEELA